MRLYVKLAALVCAFVGVQVVLAGEGWEASFYVRTYFASLRGDVGAESAAEDYYNRHRFGKGTAEIEREMSAWTAAAERAEAAGCTGGVREERGAVVAAGG